MGLSRLATVLCVAGVLSGAGAARAQSAASETMPRADALPATIPMFPLGDVTLFPNVSLPLHIFEPRYRAMVADALKGDRIIGMVLLRPGYEADYEGRPPVYPVGCAGAITDVKELPDGRYLIMVRGLMKFRVLSEDQTRPYRLARVEAIREQTATGEQGALHQSRRRLETLLASAAPPGSSAIPSGLSDEGFVDMVAQQLDIEPLARQDLLERSGPLARAEALIDLLAVTAAPRR